MLLKKNKNIIYTQAKVPELNLGIFSFSASGAITAANASRVSDRCHKRHGRWKIDTAKDGYIDDCVENKLFITKKLKL